MVQLAFGATAVTVWFGAGIVLGSFLNVIGYRVPRGESMIRPGSHCTLCGQPLRFWELIPVLSWLLLLGQCSHCKKPIAVRYPVAEVVTGSLFAMTVHTVPDWPGRIAWFAFWTLMVAIVVTDLTSMRVPNVLSIPGAVVVIGLSIGCGVQPWKQALLGAISGFGLLFLLHLLTGGKMGMGDAKLYLSVGAVLGPLLCVESLVIASFSGALVGIGMRCFGLMQRREFMPFVPHILIGAFASTFFGQTLTHWYIHQLLGL